MKYALRSNKITQEVINTKNLVIFLDFDGTLSPIVASPHEAVLPSKTKTLLKKMAFLKYVKIGIISGRILEDIREKIKLNNLWYAGSHGMEIFVNNRTDCPSIPSKFFDALKRWKCLLQAAFQGVEGVTIEEKKFSLALHYRLVPSSQKSKFFRLWRKLITLKKLERFINVYKGKKVFEFVSNKARNKGGAVLSILRRFSPKGDRTVIYIGDDVTDEDAFKAIGVCGITIKVGHLNAKSQAFYYLRNTDEVYEFLMKIYRLMKHVS